MCYYPIAHLEKEYSFKNNVTMQKDKISRFIPGKTRIKYGGAVVDKKELFAIQKVLDRNWWTLDVEGKMFEDDLSQATSVKHSLFVNSGSSALLLALSALNLEEGSEIIIPAVNFPTVVSACMVNRLIPVFVDVDLNNLCIDLENAKKAITKKTKAIVVVSIAGNTIDVDKINFFKKKGIITILDNCDGYGTTYKNKPIESYFDISVTSFHAAHIITTGEGGALFTNNTQYYKNAKSMREWGRADDSDTIKVAKEIGLPSDYPGRYTYITRGFNLKPIELQAAMGRIQLKKLRKIKKARRENYARLLQGIKKKLLPLQPSIEPKDTYISWFAFPITIKKSGIRGELRKYLENHNIETRVIFAGNITRQPAYKQSSSQKMSTFKVYGSLKNSDVVLNDSFFISVHPTITVEMINFILNILEKFFQDNSSSKKNKASS